MFIVKPQLRFPAVATSYMQNERKRRIIEYLGETFGLAGGLLASYYFDLPTGPAIVWGIALMMPLCLWKEKRR
ncbi:MAG: hypothetical protein IJ184_03855 [Alphaproteobacteria bacterium]|nr:hypothetical protein [Alphaproteobacteria bacterium]